MSSDYSLDYPYAWGAPTVTGRFKSSADDFRVDELLGFEPDNDGQHRLLHIEKRNTNTDWLAKQLARFADVASKDVSYAGLKDRNAVTTQWFSVDLAGKPEPDWMQLNNDEITVLTVAPHRRKLKRGALQGNRFELVVRDIDGDVAELEHRLQIISAQGVPNYYGEQRFGYDGRNLEMAAKLFAGEIRVKDRNKRSLYLSSARSYLFNKILAARVSDGSWNRVLPGEVMNLNNRHAFFLAEADDDTLEERLEGGDIHPSGPLWGRGTLLTEGVAAALEQQLLEGDSLFKEGLERVGMKQERRALRLLPERLQWHMSGDVLTLRFALNAGSYATTVLRELISTPLTEG